VLTTWSRARPEWCWRLTATWSMSMVVDPPRIAL
jgi:hypothetical protein